MKDVDLDLLADHLGGALDGTSEGARVADLIATDPAWAQAAARLSGALDAVAADLAALPDPVMPDDVTARLDSALRTTAGPAAGRGGRGRPRRADGEVVRPATEGARPAGEATRPAGDGARPAEQPPRPPARPARRRRRARWGAGLAAAAAAAGFAAFGISNLDFATTDEGATTFGAEEDGGPDRAATDPDPTLLASGGDYQRGTLPPQPPQAERFELGPQAQQESQPDDNGRPGIASDTLREDGTVPAALQHLWPLPEECLAAVQQSFPSGPQVDAVDYAHFEGEAALMIWLTDDEGQRWITVSGDRCGIGDGADERHRARVP